MPNCAVATCRNNNRNTKGTNIKYHQFPKAANVCSAWVHACKRKDKINVTHARVCSDHFCGTDYVRDLESELLKTENKRLLKETAVPSVNLPKLQNVTTLATTLPITQKSMTEEEKQSFDEIKSEPEELEKVIVKDEAHSELEGFTKVHIKEERDLALEENDCWDPYQAKEFQPKLLKEEKVWTSVNDDLVKDCDDKPNLDINEESVSQAYNSSDETNSKEELLEGIPSADSPIKCEICDKSFDQNRYLKTHMLTHTDEHPFQCEICKKNFTLKKYLKRHMIIHTQNRTFECTICHKSFFYNHSLTHHMVIHNEIRYSEFQCEICSKHFFEKRYLDRHMVTHRFDRPFKCNICSKCFSRKSSLNRHLITHGNDRPFQCQQCSKSFSRKSALTAHLVTHTGDRPFQCKICKKSFSFASSLSSHTHIDSLQFQCELCKKSFRKKSSLTRHISTHSSISL